MNLNKDNKTKALLTLALIIIPLMLTGLSLQFTYWFNFSVGSWPQPYIAQLLGGIAGVVMMFFYNKELSVIKFFASVFYLVCLYFILVFETIFVAFLNGKYSP